MKNQIPRHSRDTLQYYSCIIIHNNNKDKRPPASKGAALRPTRVVDIQPVALFRICAVSCTLALHGDPHLLCRIDCLL